MLITEVNINACFLPGDPTFPTEPILTTTSNHPDGVEPGTGDLARGENDFFVTVSASDPKSRPARLKGGASGNTKASHPILSISGNIAGQGPHSQAVRCGSAISKKCASLNPTYQGVGRTPDLRPAIRKATTQQILTFQEAGKGRREERKIGRRVGGVGQERVLLPLVQRAPTRKKTKDKEGIRLVFIFLSHE